MLSYRFVLRHFTRHWRINLIVLVSLLLATTFLSALPMYTTAIAERTLRANLESATGPARHIQFSRPGHPMTAALWGDIREVMGALLSERVDVFETGENAIRSASFIFRPDGTAIVVDEEAYFRVWSFDELETTVNVVEGRFPRYLEPDPFNLAFQEQEVAIGREAAAAMGITVGDELRTAGGDLHLLVVGLLEPQDPAAERWFGDPAPFGIERVERGNQPDLVNLSLLVPMLTMRNTFAGSNEYWRALTDVSTLNMANVAQVRGDLMEIQSRWEGLVLDSSLLAMIDAHLRDLETAEVSVFLLAGQSFLFVLYTITIASSFVLDRTRSELATMADRGVNGGQLTGIFAVEAGLLAFVIALPAGPLLARLLLQVWSGETLPAQVPMGSWGLALAAALFGWLALVLSVAWAMRHGSTLSWQQAQARPGQRTNWQRAYVDVFLLALAGLIYWQLNETGTFINIGRGETDAGLADPLLLLGPTLFLLAIALLFLRFFPLLLRLAAWLSKRLGMTTRSVCKVLQAMFGLKLTPGGLTQALDRMADKLQPTFDTLVRELRRQSGVWADETSWWVGGPGWWLWTFTSPETTVYRVDTSRGRDVVLEMLGQDFAGVLTSDCLASYENLPYKMHKCYAHHLKAIAQACEQQPTTYLAQVRVLLKAAMILDMLRADLPPPAWGRRRQHLEHRADVLLSQPRRNSLEERVRLRLNKRRRWLFTFLDHAGVEATNNRAERALRPAVITRKLSCGNKTHRGKRTWEILASLAATCQQRGQDFVEWISPHLALAPAIHPR